jgi:hypothetical protein
LAPTANWKAALALIALFASGCATPVGVKRLDEQAAHRELNANVLSTGTPSDYSTQILERSALSDRFKSDPQTVLAELNSGLGKPDERDRLFALSELSFDTRKNRGINATILRPPPMRTPSCSRPIRPTHPVRTIRACDSLLIFTIGASLWGSRPKTERKLILASVN